MAAESKTAVVAALLGNAALAILKGIATAVTGSAAMLAETFHSIADTGNQVLLMLGMRLSRRPPDALHPFGHGRDVYFWAFVVAMMLFSVGGAFSLWEAVSKLRHPTAHGSLLMGYAVIGLVLIGVAIFLAFENYSLLIGEAASPEVQARLREVIEADPAVAKLVGLHTVHLGPDSIVVVAETAFRDLRGDAIAEAVLRLEARIADALKGRTSPRLIVVEPRPRETHAAVP